MMRKILISVLVIGALIVLGFQTSHAESPKGALEGRITMSGAWALYPMAVKWAEEFQKLNPGVKIDIAAGGAGKGMADALANIADLGMVSRDINPEEVKKGAWWVSVTKDAVVPTVNESNPEIKDLLARGVKKETLYGIWISGAVKTWGEVVNRNVPHSIRVYNRSDACGAAQTWADYFGKKQEDLQGLGVYGDPGLAAAVSKDILGTGYNNINYVYDANSKKPVKGIRVLPIDLNGNGRIDSDENFYTNRDQIIEAINSGKYPSPPARNLHFVAQGKPKQEVVIQFLKWVLTDGQKYVPETGYINLTKGKLQSELQKLSGE